MRKITILSLLMAFAVFAIAQGKIDLPKNKVLKVKQGVAYTSDRAAFWTDDFSVPSHWVAGTGAGASADTWAIGTAAPGCPPYNIAAIASTTATNGFALFDSNCLCSGNQIANLTTASSINCTGHAAVQLQFQEMYRRYVDSTFVFVSTNGTSWTKFQISPNVGYADNATTPNPTTVSVNISSAVATNPATVWIRFQFYSPTAMGTSAGCGYAWMIDDVQLIDAMTNEIAINKIYADFSGMSYYGCTPISQMGPINFGAAVSNGGSAAQTNIALTVNANNGAFTTSTGTNNPIASLAAGANDTTHAEGTPTVTVPTEFGVLLSVDQDQTDEFPANNSDSVYFMVDTVQYLRGQNATSILTSYSFGTAAPAITGMEYGANYHFGYNGIVDNITAFLYGAHGTGTVVGKLYTFDGTTHTLVGQTDPYTPAGPFGTFEAINIPLQTPYTVTPPLVLTATVQMNITTVGTDTVYVLGDGAFFGNAAIGGAAYLQVSGNWGWYSITGNVPLIGLTIQNPTGLKEVVTNNTVTVYPNPTTGILNITNVENAVISVYNMLGQEVLKANNVKSIDMNNMQGGSYFVKIQTKDNVITKKINLVK
ncbi:MAG: T9SS type A sorting domain-containing protein [Bacteroidia bacterium]|nr:T9SS type A sorting domain-containing protein [Bacteroidia bacterium]